MPNWSDIVAANTPLVWKTLCRLAPAEGAGRAFIETFLSAHEAAHRDSVSDWRILLQSLACRRGLAILRQEASVDDPSLSGQIRVLLARLPESQAMAFCLRYFCDFSFSEISVELHIPLDSVAATVNAASTAIGPKLLEAKGEADSAGPVRTADDLLEEAVRQTMSAEPAPMPAELPEQTCEAIAAVPEVSFEKPPEKSRAVPIAIVMLIVAILAGAAALYYMTREIPPAFTYEQVAESLSSIKSARYRMAKLLKLPDGRSREIQSEITLQDPGRMRQVMQPPDVKVIWDNQRGKTLTLEEMKNRATLRDTADMFEESRPVDVLALLRGIDGRVMQPAGKVSLAGRPVQGYRLAEPQRQIVIWSDLQTRLPVLIEMTLPTANPPAKALLSDFAWNPQIDPMQLSLEPPAGFELNAIRVDLKSATEHDLVKALAVAARINGGRFPDQFDRAGMSQLIDGLYRMLPADKQSPEYRAAKEDLEADLLQLGRGWLFIAEPDSGEEWHYAGQGVMFGSETPILWYRPIGSVNYRVIDGAMSVRPIQPNKLPERPATRLTRATTRPTSAAPLLQP